NSIACARGCYMAALARGKRFMAVSLSHARTGDPSAATENLRSPKGTRRPRADHNRRWLREFLLAAVVAAAAALFGETPEEVLELGPLLGREDLADLVVAPVANLIKLRIHLLADGV